jgi:hypothetical protein
MQLRTARLRPSLTEVHLSRCKVCKSLLIPRHGPRTQLRSPIRQRCNCLLMNELLELVRISPKLYSWHASCTDPLVCFLALWDPRSLSRRSCSWIITGLRKHRRATGLVLTQPEKRTQRQFAPRCDVTASNSTQEKPGQPARFSFFGLYSRRGRPSMSSKLRVFFRVARHSGSTAIDSQKPTSRY